MRKKKRERRGANRLRKKEEANKYIFALDTNNTHKARGRYICSGFEK